MTRSSASSDPAPNFFASPVLEEDLELCNRHLSDVLLLDLRIPKKDGLQVIIGLMAHRVSKPRVIVMTTYQSEKDFRRALEAGAKGYLV